MKQQFNLNKCRVSVWRIEVQGEAVWAARESISRQLVVDSRRRNMATYTRKEIEARNTTNDAVFVIDNVVYNVTKFLDEHPGGHEVLMDRAGKDASENFADVGHSSDAKELMKKFAIGEVVEADRIEVQKKDVSWEEHASKESSNWSVWLPPIFLGILATVVYNYLFG